MSTTDKNTNDRPEAYPKPTETDSQLQNQPEYIDQQPNSFETDISDIPAEANPERSNETENNSMGTP